ncbi:MAG: sigma-70 family RNA polymerase sigma factor [Puniceicoccales bacterium]|jgi:RNA polymerase sigma-70 factor|nr:sigma-70 family RNA polymerase sigma factor [Puniceicoccales bacterium]
MPTSANSTGETPPSTAGGVDVNAILGELWLPMRTYAVALVGGDVHAIDEIMQESAIHIWEHQAQLPEIKNLRMWAFRIVYFKALSFRRDRSLSPLVGFSEQAMDFIAESVEATDDLIEKRHQTLAKCIGELRNHERTLLTQYYEERYSIKEIAASIQKNEEAVYKQIARLRRALRRCIEKAFPTSKTFS